MPAQPPLVSGWNQFLNPPAAAGAPPIVPNPNYATIHAAMAGSAITSDPNAIYFDSKDHPNFHLSNLHEASIALTAREINALTRDVRAPAQGGPADHIQETSNIIFRSAENAFQYIKIQWMMNNGYFGNLPLQPAGLKAELETKLNVIKTADPNDIATVLNTALNPAPNGSPHTRINEFDLGPMAAPAGAKMDRADSKPQVQAIMNTVIKKKFTQNPDLAAALLEAGDRPIVSANPNNDAWGLGKVQAGGQPPLPGSNQLGNTLTSMLSNANKPELEAAVKHAKEHEEKVNAQVTALNETLLRLNGKLKDYERSAGTNNDYSGEAKQFEAETRYQFPETALANTLSQTQATFETAVAADAAKQAQVTVIFETLKNAIADQHVKLMLGTNANPGFDVNVCNKAFDDAAQKLSDLGIDAREKLQAHKETDLLKHIEKHNTLLKETANLAFSLAAMIDAGINTHWKKLYEKPGEEDVTFAQVVNGNLMMKGPLKEGDYKRDGSEVTLIVTGNEKDGFAMTFNASTTTDKTVKEGISEMMKANVAGGAEVVTFSYDRFDPDKMVHYFKQLDMMFEEARKYPDIQVNVRDHIRKMRAAINDKSFIYNTFWDPLGVFENTIRNKNGNQVKPSEKLAELDKMFEDHNDNAAARKAARIQEAKDAKKDAKEVAVRNDEKRLENHLDNLSQGLHIPDAKPATQIASDNKEIERLGSALSEIKRQQVSLNNKYAKATPAEKNDLDRQAADIKNLADKFVKTLYMVRARVDDYQKTLNGAEQKNAGESLAKVDELKTQFQTTLNSTRGGAPADKHLGTIDVKAEQTAQVAGENAHVAAKAAAAARAAAAAAPPPPPRMGAGGGAGAGGGGDPP